MRHREGGSQELRMLLSLYKGSKTLEIYQCYYLFACFLSRLARNRSESPFHFVRAKTRYESKIHMIVSQSANVLQVSFADLWYTIMQFLPQLLAAVVIFIIGWVGGVVLYRVVEQVVKVLRVDDALKAAGLDEAAREAGFTLNVGALLGTLVQWFVVIVFLVTALEVLGLSRVTTFLSQVVLFYLPQVIAAILILILAAVVAEAAKNIVASSARAAGAHAGNLAGAVAKYAIWVTAILAVLNQL